MDRKILVPLGRYDRSEEMIPYIEKVSRPGMKVVFLVVYPIDLNGTVREAYGVKAALQAGQVARSYSWEANVAAARAELAPVGEALRAKGIEAAVELYAGSLSKALRSQTINGDVHLILTRLGVWQRIFAVLSGHSALVDLLTRSKRTPVLLIQAGMAA
jgi:hypothetical protein